MTMFIEISALLVLTALVTLAVRMLKQPLIIGYILSGIIAGPYLLDILHSKHELELFSKVGIVFLLFIVGIHLNPKVIKEVGSVSLITGIGQVTFTSLVGFLLAIALGIERTAALYVAIALTFSSTIIILKLLADKRDLQKLYAKIAIGVLLVQDIVATFVLIGVNVLTNDGSTTLAMTVIITLLKGAGLLSCLYIFNALVLQRLTHYVAKSQELLFLFSLAWGTGLATLFLLLGFSIEVGALVAGVSLAVTPYADEIASRLKPLRDFFIVIFFILLGSQMVLSNLGVILIPAIILSIFVMIGNPVIMILLMNMTGHSRKTGFLAGMTVAQISEFSLILASLGLQVGHLSQETMSLVTLVALITISGSTYLILYAEKLYPRMTGLLRALELLKRKRTEKGSLGEDYSSVIFGYDRVGDVFVKTLQDAEHSFLVVDYNPSSIERLEELGLPFRFGDAGDVEFLEELPLRKPQLIISTIPDLETNTILVRHMLARNPHSIVITLADTILEAKELYEIGASYVILPHYLGADVVAKLVKKHGVDRKGYKEETEKLLMQFG